MINLLTKAFDFRVYGIPLPRGLRGLSWIPVIVLALLFVSSVHGATEVVVAVRYVQEQGTSHAHLYLFGESGKLIHQLTNDDSYQDSDPFFSPDGKTIVFTREANGKTGIWSLEPHGEGLQQLSETPDWYKQVGGSSHSTDSDSLGKPAQGTDAYKGDDGLMHYRLPDGSAELIVKDSEDTQNPGETYFLKDLKTGKQVQIASESGFTMGLTTINTAQQSHFLIEPPLNLAFILERLNSTDGSEVLALDLKTHEIRELSRPPGERESSPPPPVEVDPASPMAGEGAFLAITRVRFVPFGSGHKTANSSYLERYDHQLHIIRYAHEGAALFYGASVYRTGKKPQAIWIPRASLDPVAPPEPAAGAAASQSSPPAPGPDVQETAVPVTNPIPADGGVWMYNPTLKGWTWADINGWQYFKNTWKWNGEGPAPSSHPPTPHPPEGGFPNPPPPGAGGAPAGSGAPSQGGAAKTGADGIVLYTPGASLSGTGNLSGTGASLYTPGASLYTPGASLSGTGTSLYTPGKSLYTAGIALTPGVEVKETLKVVRINLRGDILFDFDKSDIRPSAETTLSQIAKLILKYPKAAVQIDGYTDSKGSATYNLGLSDRRSASVKGWLVSRGIRENSVSTRGWGAEHPVAPNNHPNGSDDPEGRQKNRRVEITIHK